MKVAHKVGAGIALILVVVVSLLSWNQYRTMKESLQHNIDSSIKEVSVSLAYQISNWLNGKKELINLLAQSIDSNFDRDYIHNQFNRPLLKEQFITVFGGLDVDGVAIHNDPSWDTTGWDARMRPWYKIAKANNTAVLTEPYVDSDTKETIISVVANLTEHGQFKGAFGGDLSLKVISNAVNTLNFGGAGYAFILSEQGKIISHPNKSLNDKDIASIFDGRTPQLSSELKLLALKDQSVFVSFTPLKALDSVKWYIGVVVERDKVMAKADAMAWQAFWSVLLSVAIGLAAVAMLMGKLLQPLTSLHQSLVEINSGEGDLTRRLTVTSDDEFGQLAKQFNQFITFLQKLISEVKSLNQQVGNSSHNTSNEANQSADSLQQQLSELDQLASAMLQMAASANEVASNAQNAASAASKADSETEYGVNVVSSSTDAIAQLATDMEQTVATVKDMAQLSTNIESILQVINGIAEQTNLLALNAAIEAARAGESGRGFAVVADEVRTLASRTQESTNEIRDTINKLQAAVANTEERILQSSNKANATVIEANKTFDTLQQIRQSITLINDMNIQIAAAAEEQSATSEEINRNTNNIRDISQAVSEGAQQQLQYCQQMVGQVSEQQGKLEQFKV